MARRLDQDADRDSSSNNSGCRKIFSFPVITAILALIISVIGLLEIVPEKTREKWFCMLDNTCAETATQTPTIPIASSEPESSTEIPTLLSTMTSSPTLTNTPRPTGTPTPLPTNIPASAILYEEDFEDGVANGWQQRTGESYRIIDFGDGNFVWSNIGGGEIILMEAIEWKNYAVELDVYVVEWNIGLEHPNLSVKVRRPLLDFCNSYQINIYGTQFAMYSQESGNCIGGEILGLPLDVNLLDFEWHTFLIQVFEDEISWKFDNREMQSVINDDHPIGGISLIPFNTGEIFFDNIRVWSLDG